MIYNVKVKNFEGPMDLLLYFIKRDELDIYDIPISNITEKFIDVIGQWDKQDLAVAGEFIVMASVLMRIKVKMILPIKKNDDFGEIIDPRKELMHQLIQYKKFRAAADILDKLRRKRISYFTRPTLKKKSTGMIPVQYAISKDIKLFDLAKVFKEILDGMTNLTKLEVDRDSINSKIQKMDVLRLFDGEGKLTFENLISVIKSRYELILYFLVIMELIKEGFCTVNQNIIFGKIELNLLNT
jgi:segregation and condensation protein A